MQTSVLMVEDDRVMGEMLTDVLEDAGYQVTLAGGGAAALDLLEHQIFAVVVSDVRMPAVDGLQVLQAARQNDPQPEVILLTGYGALESSLVALREGAFDYLLKPCHPEKLLKRVSDAISARETRLRQAAAVQRVVTAFSEMIDTPTDQPGASVAAPARQPTPDPGDDKVDHGAIQVGPLYISSAYHEVTLRGEPLHLTPTEYTLLRAVAAKPGRAFTYRELVYAMHGYDVSSAEAKILLKTHVRNIRHKLGAGYLINIRGTGYRFLVPDPNKTSGSDEDDDE